ncbi:MAG: preprotein translocase subunit YajC [Candidatus Omnitrophica bacterium]|nr:preprotein translocase subunit YajC [Candidatus Omnitrophota bacterium]
MVFAFAFAAADGAVATPQQPNPLISFLPIILIFLVFYFLLIRPQKKAQDDHGKMLKALQKNDEIVTSGGVLGTIVNIQDDIVTLRVDDNTRIKILKSSVAKLMKSHSDGAVQN